VSTTPGELGIYSVDDSGASGVYRHHVTLKGVYAWDSAVFDGQVYLACSPGGQIYAWDGSVPRRVRQLATASAPYPWELRGIAQFNQALWVAYQDATGLGLLRYDGTSWSRPVSGLAGDAPRDLAAYGGELYLGAYRAALATAYRVSFGAVRPSGSLDSGLFDAGLPDVTKVLRSATVVHGALAAGQSIQLLYRREDTGVWASLGTSSAVGVTSATFAFPAGTTFKQAAFRLVLVGPGTSSPVAYELLVRYAVQPATLREWEFPVVLEGTPELPLARLDGSAEPLTGAQLSAAL
jgi:hypothetical protein